MLYIKTEIYTQNHLKQEKFTNQIRNTHSETMKYGKQMDYTYHSFSFVLF